MRTKRLLTTAVVVLALFFSVGASAEDAVFKYGRNAQILMQIFRDINFFYVDNVDPDKLLKDAASGMTDKLDPYTEFIPADEMAQFEVMTTGKYGGMGAVIRPKGDYIAISEPYKGFPADKAGLVSGDKILEIDGSSIKGLGATKVSSLLRGEPGSKFKVKVEKLYTGDTTTLEIKRERITVHPVPYYGMVNDSVGYIYLTDFTEGCSDEVKKAFVKLREGGNLKGLILDLRGNGGGILQEAVKIVSLFVPNETAAVSMKGKVKHLDAVFRTSSEPLDLTIPLTVLVNRGSASASEIVAGALQDLDRAVLVGQRTFGKGLVQTPRPMGYNSYLKVTTAKYYIPSGRCIQALDYSHKAEDGSVSSVPDSLIKEFTTAGGRKVYDGGGVMPDVKTQPEYMSRFAVITLERSYINDFVDDYMRRNHAAQIDLNDFKLSDSEYDLFRKFIADKDMNYQSQTKVALDKLRERAETERYLDQIKPQLDAIEALLREDKSSGLDRYDEELRDMIESEIVERRFYMSGLIARKLRTDKNVEQAVKVLADPAAYHKIVTSQNTDRK